jgi:hypothetical protein
MNGVEVVLLQGRTHPYEGYTIDKVKLQIRASDKTTIFYPLFVVKVCHASSGAAPVGREAVDRVQRRRRTQPGVQGRRCHDVQRSHQSHGLRGQQSFSG